MTLTADQTSFLNALTRAAEEDRVSNHLFRWLLDVHDLSPADLDTIETVLEQRIATSTTAQTFVRNERAGSLA